MSIEVKKKYRVKGRVARFFLIHTIEPNYQMAIRYTKSP
jgi:hypothetical protein